MSMSKYASKADFENRSLADRLSDEADQCRNDGADDIAKLLDEASAKLLEWRSIDTAPKDGTNVLVVGLAGHWVASFRFPMRGEPQCESHYAKEWRDGGGRWATPTHWMPLPQPPEVKL